jgi:hypothetical protein
MRRCQERRLWQQPPGRGVHLAHHLCCRGCSRLAHGQRAGSREQGASRVRRACQVRHSAAAAEREGAGGVLAKAHKRAGCSRGVRVSAAERCKRAGAAAAVPGRGCCHGGRYHRAPFFMAGAAQRGQRRGGPERVRERGEIELPRRQ